QGAEPRRVSMRADRILVVDDDADARAVVTRALERLDGVVVLGEGDAQAAAARLAEEPFDLLVTDQRLGDERGVDLIAIARRQDPWVPAILLTGAPSLEGAVACMKLGRVDYVTRPFVPEELQASARRFLDAGRLRAE